MPHKTRIFFDTEFIEDGKTIDLLSIGIVRDDGAALYLENSEANWTNANDWVLANVLPKLKAWPSSLVPVDGAVPAVRTLHPGWATRREIAHAVRVFVGPAPEFWAYYADYDWVVLCQLYGQMIDLPEGWPMYCRDFKQWLDEEKLEAVKLPEADAHNALTDAKWLKHEFDSLKGTD